MFVWKDENKWKRDAGWPILKSISGTTSGGISLDKSSKCVYLKNVAYQNMEPIQRRHFTIK